MTGVMGWIHKVCMWVCNKRKEAVCVCVCTRVLNPVDSTFTSITIMDAIYHVTTRVFGCVHVAWPTVWGEGGWAGLSP